MMIEKSANPQNLHFFYYKKTKIYVTLRIVWLSIILDLYSAINFL